MITVRDIEQFLYDWAPPDTAESWDNVGLLVGRPDRPVRRVLVALDVTPAVAAEAAELGADLIVAHHPVMNVRWHEREMQTLRDDTRLGGLLTCPSSACIRIWMRRRAASTTVWPKSWAFRAPFP